MHASSERRWKIYSFLASTSSSSDALVRFAPAAACCLRARSCPEGRIPSRFRVRTPGILLLFHREFSFSFSNASKHLRTQKRRAVNFLSSRDVRHRTSTEGVVVSTLGSLNFHAGRALISFVIDACGGRYIRRWRIYISHSESSSPSSYLSLLGPYIVLQERAFRLVAYTVRYWRALHGSFSHYLSFRLVMRLCREFASLSTYRKRITASTT